MAARARDGVGRTHPHPGRHGGGAAEAEDGGGRIAPGDLRVTCTGSGGHGGQSVNTTDAQCASPTCPLASCGDAPGMRSQAAEEQRKRRCVLKSRLLELMQREQEQEFLQNRRSQVGSGDRSERIRIAITFRRAA